MKGIHDYRGEERAAWKRRQRAGRDFCRKPFDSRPYAAADAAWRDAAKRYYDAFVARRPGIRGFKVDAVWVDEPAEYLAAKEK